MNTTRKVWLTLAAFGLGMAILACSCGSITSLFNSTPTTAPLPPQPSPTTPPIPTVPTVPLTTSNLPYYDDFSDPNSGWDVYNESFGSAGYQDGYYFVTATGSSEAVALYAKNYDNTTIDVDAEPVSGPSDNNFEYGVSCRVQSNLDSYDFSISADGYFAVYVVTDGGSTFTSLLQGDEYQYSDAINQDLSLNHLTVTCNGSHLTFAVNGQVLYDGQDSTFSNGQIGLFTDIFDETTPDEVHFDDLLVSAP